MAFNKQNNITPQSIKKAIREGIESNQKARELVCNAAKQTDREYELTTLIAQLEKEMELAARNLQFEQAALFRDQIEELKKYTTS